MSWQLLVPGTQTVTVANAPFTYPTGLPLAPVGPGSTNTATTLPPFGGVMPLFPGFPLPPVSFPQPAATRIVKAGMRNLRTAAPLLDVRGLDARGNQVRHVGAPVERARMPAHLDDQPSRRRSQRSVVSRMLALGRLL